MVSDRAADLAQQPAAVVVGVILPARQIHMLASLLNIAGKQPGDGCNMAIPGPCGVFRMTVLASSLDDGKRRRIDPCLGKNGLVVLPAGNRPKWMNERTAYRGHGGDASCNQNCFDQGILSLTCPTVASGNQ